MSYIVSLFKLPKDISSVDELPTDFDVEPLGSKAAILALLGDLFPDADFSDPTWVVLDKTGFSIEFIVGEKDPVDSLGLRIHGDESWIAVARVLCERNGWRAYDTSSGNLINFSLEQASGL